MAAITIAVLAATALVAAILALPRISGATGWRATVTPLASIIGSGFLVLGPILNASFGTLAPLAMVALCAVAWAFGAAIRVNIGALDSSADRPAADAAIEALASATLAFAYVISVAYYLNLFGAFALSLTPIASAFAARIVTSALYALILIVGWTKGYAALERMEALAVSLKLAIIAGLVAGLAFHFAEGGTLPAFHPASVTGWQAVTLIFGLIVTVQGFETARYLGETYDPATRIAAMRRAQGIAAVIYLIYTVLLVAIFAPGEVALTETAIVDMMATVAVILPSMLVLAALGAQFSAAVADTSGAGGLAHELTKGRIPPRLAYAMLTVSGLALTWAFDVFQIIAFASRAFAAYYALQSLLAALARMRQGRHAGAAAYGTLALLGLAIAVFGRAVEGG